ncbi:hypothetical protein MRX96_007381 [Rhipicephalus microplus]
MEKQPARSFGMPVRLGAKQDSSSDSITRRSEARQCRVISRAQHFVQRAASSDVISETVIEAIYFLLLWMKPPVKWRSLHVQLRGPFFHVLRKTTRTTARRCSCALQKPTSNVTA